MPGGIEPPNIHAFPETYCFHEFKNTLLNTKVSLIENNPKDEKVIIKTTDENAYCADHVIVTIPLGVLKETYETLFKPPLPEEKIKTIRVCSFLHKN